MEGSGRKPRLVLTERDMDLLLSVYKYRYLSTSQLQGLHFPSLQTTNRRLRLLADGGFLSTFRSPGIDERLVMLAKKGAEAVAETLLVPFEALGWEGGRREPKDYYFLRHFLAVGDFRIALTRACERMPDVKLLGFIPEHLGEKKPRGGVQKYIREVVADIDRPRGKIAHTPDGVFALEKGGRAALFFLEVDRGTEVLTNPERGFLKTLRFYLNYLVSEEYQRYREDFGVGEPFKAFRVLVVTSSAKRLENIRTVGGRVDFRPAHAKRFIWLVDEGGVSEETAFSSIWSSLDPEDGKRYAIAP
ncbi:MAG: replication-relaxation family protein [Candidatus Eisenbacteria bacterium]